MKNIKILLLGIFATMFFSGCLQVDTKVNLNQDGSGTIEETVVIKSSVIEMMKDFAMSFDSTKSEEFEIFKEDELKSKAKNYGEGVKYVSGEKVKIKGFEGFKVIYSFADINKVKINPSPDDKVPFGDELQSQEEIPAKDYLKFNFKEGNPSTLVINFPKPEEDQELESEDDTTTEEEDSLSNSANLDKLVEMFDGMKMTLSIDFSKNIEETDASYVDGSKITLMQMDFSELIKHKDILLNLEKKKPETMEEMKEIIGNIPGIKLETKEKVTIKF